LPGNDLVAEVFNNSPRPIRDVTCRVKGRRGQLLLTPDYLVMITVMEMPPGQRAYSVIPDTEKLKVIRAASRYGFVFNLSEPRPPMMAAARTGDLEARDL
jgi:hypothetical protein